MLCAFEHALLTPLCPSPLGEVKAFCCVSASAPAFPQDPNQCGRLFSVPIYHFTDSRTLQLQERRKRKSMAVLPAIQLLSSPYDFDQEGIGKEEEHVCRKVTRAPLLLHPLQE